MNPKQPEQESVASQEAVQPYYGYTPNTNLYAPRIKTTEPKHFASTDSLFAAVMILCGFLFIHLETFFFGAKGMGVTFTSVVFIASAWAYMEKSGFSQTRESLLYVGLASVTALRFSLLHGGEMDFFNILLLIALSVYWIAVTTRRQLGSDITAVSLGDVVNQMICVPFSNFSCLFAGISNGLSKTKKGKGFAGAFLGLLIFLPVLVIVTGLLVSADAAFEQWTVRFADAFLDNFFLYVLEFIVCVPVACYLFGLLYGNIKGRYTSKITEESVLKTAKAFHIAPASAIYACLGALAAIYMVFFAAQTTYLFSAFENHLPEAMTYAEYARRGFFELCQVAAINLAVIAAAYLLLKQAEDTTGTPRILKGFTVLLSAQTLLLLATAVSKMVMYIGSYGLTPLRVYTTWFMGLLFILFCLLILNQFRPFKLAKAAVLVTVVAFLVLSYGNVDGQIARYNIARYEAGTLAGLDLWGSAGLDTLTDGAVPYLVELYQTTDDDEMKEHLEEVLKGFRLRQFHRSIDQGVTRTWNLQSQRSWVLLNEALYVAQPVEQ